MFVEDDEACLLLKPLAVPGRGMAGEGTLRGVVVELGVLLK